MVMLAVTLLVLAFGGAAFAVAFGQNETSQKRIAGIVKAPPRATRAAAESQGQRRKTMQQLLKEIEQKQAEKKPKMTLRRRLDRAGFDEVPIRNYWIASGLVAFLTASLCLFGAHMSLLLSVGAAFSAGFGLPRWVLNFRKRREKRFTNDFAGAIDVIVRSVKSGLPTSDALKIVAGEFLDPVGSEFKRLIESMKVGVTLEQALKRMFENMPTTEVSFFAIVMTILKQKSGGNLSEALGNLAAVLRDRKRLEGKIQAMSSEAKASAMIIGSLPPGVMALGLFHHACLYRRCFSPNAGNLLLAGCVFWMGLGIFVMKKMINFKH